jgi:hypothetical protein
MGLIDKSMALVCPPIFFFLKMAASQYEDPYLWAILAISSSQTTSSMLATLGSPSPGTAL